MSTPGGPIYYIVNQILYPLVQGCESKDIKIIKVSISSDNYVIIIRYKHINLI